MSDGDAQFTKFYSGTHEAVGRYCLRRLPPDDAREALTETFLVAWRRRDDLPEGQDAILWLYGIARNVVRNRSRSTRRSGRVVNRLRSEPTSPAPGPAEQIIRNEEDRELLHAMSTLSSPDREILKLRAYEELDYLQIALVLDCSVDAARKRLSRALKRLRARLGEHDDDTPRVNQKGGHRSVG